MSKLIWKSYWKSGAWLSTIFVFLCLGDYYQVFPWHRSVSQETSMVGALCFYSAIFFEMTRYLLKEVKRNEEKIKDISLEVEIGKRHVSALSELERRLVRYLIEFWYDQKLQTSAHAHAMRGHFETILIGYVQEHKLSNDHKALIEELMRGSELLNLSPRGAKRLRRLAFVLSEIAQGKLNYVKLPELISMLDEK